MQVVFITSLFLIQVSGLDQCLRPSVSLSQTVEKRGFHRNVKWLLESDSVNNSCQFAVHLRVHSGMFVNPYELADLKRMGELSAVVKGVVNIESPSHEASPHRVYVFVEDLVDGKAQLTLPIHLRYQKAKIGGGYAYNAYAFILTSNIDEHRVGFTFIWSMAGHFYQEDYNFTVNMQLGPREMRV